MNCRNRRALICLGESPERLILAGRVTSTAAPVRSPLGAECRALTRTVSPGFSGAICASSCGCEGDGSGQSDRSSGHPAKRAPLPAAGRRGGRAWPDRPALSPQPSPPPPSARPPNTYPGRRGSRTIRSAATAASPSSPEGARALCGNRERQLASPSLDIISGKGQSDRRARGTP